MAVDFEEEASGSEPACALPWNLPVRSLQKTRTKKTSPSPLRRHVSLRDVAAADSPRTRDANLDRSYRTPITLRV